LAARDDEFADFVAARYRALLRTGLALTGDLGHAEDLAQSALIKTYLAWGRLREITSAEAYARRTLVRLALRERQRRWHGEISSGQLPEPHATGTAAGAGQADLGDLAIDLRRALATLPIEQRAVLVLRYLDDLPEAETAQLLGVSPGTVKSRAARGLASLRTAGLLITEGDRHER
jgi:RNA polymerase sigma-70 factor (sigma-E family)